MKNYAIEDPGIIKLMQQLQNWKHSWKFSVPYLPQTFNTDSLFTYKTLLPLHA